MPRQSSKSHPTPKSPKFNSESGAYIATMIWLLFALLMMLGLAVDATLSYLVNLRVKYAAQSAAAAGVAAYMQYANHNPNVNDPNVKKINLDAQLTTLVNNITRANLGNLFQEDSAPGGGTIKEISTPADTSSGEPLEQINIRLSNTRNSLIGSIFRAFMGQASDNTLTTVTAEQRTTLKEAKIVLLLDVSGSMLCRKDAQVTDPYDPSTLCNTPISAGAPVSARRMGALQDAVKSFLNKFKGSKHKIAIVPFSFAAWTARGLDYNTNATLQDWYSVVDGLTPGTYTNIADGFFQVLTGGLMQRDTIYILFTDGAPQAGRFLLSDVYPAPSAVGSYDPDPSADGPFNQDLTPDYTQTDKNEWPRIDATTLPPSPESQQNRPTSLSNAHFSLTASTLGDSPTEHPTTPSRYDYYHFTEDCSPGATDLPADYEKYAKPGSAPLTTFKCPSALVRTPPDGVQFKNVSRSDTFFRNWPAGTTECLARHQGAYTNDVFNPDINSLVNHNCENVWLNNSPKKKPLLWNLFAPCSVHRAGYGAQDAAGNWSYHTSDSSTPIPNPPGSYATSGAPFAFENCVNSLSFHLPAVTGGNTEVNQRNIRWIDYQQVYYNSVIAMADQVRNGGGILYVVGLGPEPNFNGSAYTGGVVPPYQDIDNDFERKDFFLARVALDPFIIPGLKKYGGQSGPDPDGTLTSKSIANNLEFTSLNIGAQDYSWATAVNARRNQVGEYSPTDDPNELTAIFDRIARKILLTRIR